MSSDIELGIRRYKSLPSNLDEIQHVDIEAHNSNNPIIRSNTQFNDVIANIGATTDRVPRNVGIGIVPIDNCMSCIRRIQTVLDESPTFKYIKKKLYEYFPYILHYYTHLIFIIVFEIMFYFKYATEIEKEVIHNMIKSIVNTLVELYFEYNPDADKITLSQQMADAICAKYESGYNPHNAEIYQNCLVGIIILISIFCIIILTGTRLYGYKLVLSVIADSIMLIMLLGIFEYFFFAYIILGYQVTSIGDVVCTAVQIVYEYLKSH
jgi:hypothetical protein